MHHVSRACTSKTIYFTEHPNDLPPRGVSVMLSMDGGPSGADSLRHPADTFVQAHSHADVEVGQDPNGDNKEEKRGQLIDRVALRVEWNICNLLLFKSHFHMSKPFFSVALPHTVNWF